MAAYICARTERESTVRASLGSNLGLLELGGGLLELGRDRAVSSGGAVVEPRLVGD